MPKLPALWVAIGSFWVKFHLTKMDFLQSAEALMAQIVRWVWDGCPQGVVPRQGEWKLVRLLIPLRRALLRFWGVGGWLKVPNYVSDNIDPVFDK
jgi:hypothetical protein